MFHVSGLPKTNILKNMYLYPSRAERMNGSSLIFAFTAS